MNSSVLRWPDRDAVDKAVRTWISHEAASHPRLRRLGYFGSYANGTWGVGSDLDLVAIEERCDAPFERRGLEWNLAPLPVPAEILVYEEREWERLQAEGTRFARTLSRETIWVFSA